MAAITGHCDRTVGLRIGVPFACRSWAQDPTATEPGSGSRRVSMGAIFLTTCPSDHDDQSLLLARVLLVCLVWRGSFNPGVTMRVLYVCASILVFTLLAVVVFGMTVSQCRPSMFVLDDPYSTKTERNWTTNCANVFSYKR